MQDEDSRALDFRRIQRSTVRNPGNGRMSRVRRFGGVSRMAGIEKKRGRCVCCRELRVVGENTSKCSPCYHVTNEECPNCKTQRANDSVEWIREMREERQARIDAQESQNQD